MEKITTQKASFAPLAVRVIGYVLLTVGFFLALTKVDAYLRNTAIDECAKSSRYQVSDPKTGTVVYYPIQDVYSACLAKKNIK